MARLTEQEQQEILRYIEADKPLPEKYRFLLFEEQREMELVWNGKTSEVCNVILPFQVVERVGEPRAEKPEDKAMQLGLFGDRERQHNAWTNKLIWGDNKLILSSLKNGPLRDDIEKHGGLKLIYIDPPFDVGADFSMDIEIGDDTLTEGSGISEEIAYRDTWGKGADSFIAMIYERLLLMRDLLAEDGSIYVHCDWRVSGLVRLTLDDVFGTANFVNEIIWWYEGPQSPSPLKFGSKHDTIFRYARDINQNSVYELTYLEEEPFDPKKYKKDSNGRYFYTIPKGDYTEASIKRLDTEGKIHWTSKGTPRIKKFVEVSTDGKKLCKPKKIPDVWQITSLGLAAGSNENLAYPTQKPKALLERIIRASSNEGDIVADFFCGSGTTAAVAEEFGRKWIAIDLGKFAIHTTRKRMIGIQRQLKADGKDYSTFEILNLGKYERQHYIGTYPQVDAENAFVEFILQAYRAEKIDGFNTSHGKKAGRLVAVGPVNLPVTRLFVEEVILECHKNHITRVDILGFEFEMGLFPNILDDARAKGIDIAPKYIPADVFDKRAVEKNQVVFHDVSAIEVKTYVRESSTGVSPAVAVELTDFSVFYSQDSTANTEAAIKEKGSRIEVEKGQIIKVNKDANGIVTRETLTKKWTDWIDYWAVDFNFESKQEMTRVKNEASGEWEEHRTGNYIFENKWQSFRTKKDRSLELTSVFHECALGRRKIAVKVVDIFGNDTMTIVDVNV